MRILDRRFWADDSFQNHFDRYQSDTSLQKIPDRVANLQEIIGMGKASKLLFIIGCLNAAVAVTLSAAGAHALRAQLASPRATELFATAIQYHQFHALGLIAVALTLTIFPASRCLRWSGLLMSFGILLFCGGLYLQSLTMIHLIPGGIPAGGLAFILAWVLLPIGVARSPRRCKTN